jgi:hypothetical protein
VLHSNWPSCTLRLKVSRRRLAQSSFTQTTTTTTTMEAFNVTEALANVDAWSAGHLEAFIGYPRASLPDSATHLQRRALRPPEPDRQHLPHHSRHDRCRTGGPRMYVPILGKLCMHTDRSFSLTLPHCHELVRRRTRRWMIRDSAERLHGRVRCLYRGLLGAGLGCSSFGCGITSRGQLEMHISVVRERQ